MKNMEIREMRDRALYEAYVRGIREHDFSGEDEAADYARMQPAPSFFISAWNLNKYFVRIEHHQPMDKIFSSTRRKIRELYRRYQTYMLEHPDTKLARLHICMILVDEPAPEFYVGHDLALKIISRERAFAQKRAVTRAWKNEKKG